MEKFPYTPLKEFYSIENQENTTTFHQITHLFFQLYYHTQPKLQFTRMIVYLLAIFTSHIENSGSVWQKWWNLPKQGTIVEVHGTTFHKNTGFWQYHENLQMGHFHAAQVPTDSVNQDKNVMIENLRDTAIQEKCCGQFSLVERKFISDPKKEITVYAVATNIVMYNVFLENLGLSKTNLEGKRLRKEANLDSKGKLKWHEDLKAKQVPLKKLKAY